MKELRKFVSRPFFVIGLTCIFLFVSCTSKGTPVKQPYDGETLFKGILFAEGEVATKIPELADLIEIKSAMSPAKKSQYLAAQTKIIEDLKKKDPEFFKRFQSSVTSGDQVEVRRAITDAGNKVRANIEETLSVKIDQSLIEKVRGKVTLEELLSKENLKDPEKLKFYEQELSGLLGSNDPSLVACVALVLIVVVAVAIVWVIPLIANPSNDLMKEKVVNSIAINLKVK